MTNLSQVPEYDPNGLDPHAGGAKLDGGKNNLGLVFEDFARALWAVGEVGTLGAVEYSPSGWLSVPNGQKRYSSAMLRHHFKDLIHGPVDAKSGLLHAAHRAWNALAVLELMLREREEREQEKD